MKFLFALPAFLQACTNCKEVGTRNLPQPISQEQRAELVRNGWELAVDGRDSAFKKHEFADFNEAFGCMTRAALKAEAIVHHPEWFNVWNKLEVILTTHDIGGLSDLDYEMALFIDSC
ncbi:Oidioi.mRNA.OKI2018_I69.chr2.g4501.t1.cds [Oikopleura dioica]|uniref:4a-hydroxytetrahydrobiopterin dehydratase n=1 Tax=Oikopleura dioica TaxID=34765 RepID=A0ABN7T1T0_OIKDI|nr:Oidioi.mRNA.OKI2018_I69.chr2.g4501.t1.cds [Oikopleura dioica]